MSFMRLRYFHVIDVMPRKGKRKEIRNKRFIEGSFGVLLSVQSKRL